MSIENHAIDGPALLLAGPGTGKTYALGLRIKYLIEEVEVHPEEITVITFTSEAARNMRARISNKEKPELYLPYSQQPSNILTMHSLGYGIIRENHARIGLSEVIKVIPGDLEKSILMGDAAQLSGFHRSLSNDVKECRQIGDCIPADSPKCKICENYQKILRGNSSVDYDDQILIAVQLLESNPDILKLNRQFTKHLLVDEYQDINAAQFKLIKLLCGEHPEGLFAVGDDDQSIYSWRGGSPSFIRNFKSDFNPNAKIIPLNKSYRCHKNILLGSLKVVEEYDPDRLHKDKFVFDVQDGPQIKIHNTASDRKEAIQVRRIIRRAIPSQTVLVLVPQRNFANAISGELRRNRIGFIASAEIPGAGLPLISRLDDWLKDPTDSIALRRCIESFMDRIGSEVPSKRARKREKLQAREDAFASVSDLWGEVIAGRSDSIWCELEQKKEGKELYSTIWESFSSLLSLYRDNGNVTDFIKSVSAILSPWKKIPRFQEEIVSWVDSIRQRAFEGSGSSVRIMTFQGAKGLEADVVCVLGLEEGVIPRSDDVETISEQSRLLFVSMTRAINELHLFHARVRSSKVVLRNVFSGGRPNIEPSRFLSSIPREVSEKIYHRA